MGYYIQFSHMFHLCRSEVETWNYICGMLIQVCASLTPCCFLMMSDQDATDSDHSLNSDSDLILPIPEDGTTAAEYRQVTFVLVVAHET
jgi:hypothetical protein